ncbi:uncharacterized protein K460DRAFT_370823 [Cucurbitaria berberidis CBS 394.84]|uniref:Uncharacterized protein n=1 Tax=Cucurbitaria berberidis CBS 394.84 TaxID=1168544 RepID=A0A9P4G883_9PLEO|nr:uncharacterized protein K460DRAFT_370823 [Cucurbitaria berberidis CBS 394.84]KAF1840842.1 hypothetical protein K460DRAFT_370823 [Cucurbitaria berberidis CBS 394.84]
MTMSILEPRGTSICTYFLCWITIKIKMKIRTLFAGSRPAIVTKRRDPLRTAAPRHPNNSTAAKRTHSTPKPPRPLDAGPDAFSAAVSLPACMKVTHVA